ncbi:lipopolysaccharide assembly protein LapA domain-containing protein [Sporolactobacillus vineae]|uniref:lipopolysaccharide assembly protein LapA domain-containing protein n=1 Tax=Sporolactobacillus vineae TaxID=444463 RepID=UPI000287D1BA|nr:lipopolysaccharide assembly protein LapA domain-containing protein [Sporolactobacillus vineae]
MRKQWNLLLGLIFILIVVLLSVANVDSVAFNFLLGTAKLPLIVVIIISVLIGVILTGSFTYLKIYRQQHRIRRLERELEQVSDLQPGQADHASGEQSAAREEETRSSRRRHTRFRK